MSDLEMTPANVRARKGARPLGQVATGSVGAIFAKRGFAGADLALHWPDIVGPGVARYTRAIEMKWPRHGAEIGVGATLVVASHSAFALDLQQMSPVVIERINQRLGWRCVEKIAIQQRPITPPATAAMKTSQPTEEDNAAAGRIAAEIKSDRLREAMTRLGAGAMARSRKLKGGAGSGG